MFNPMAIISKLQNSGNPIAMMEEMFGGNPIFNRAMQMGQGKTPGELQQVVRNLARQKGMSEQDLQEFLNQFGLRL